MNGNKNASIHWSSKGNKINKKLSPWYCSSTTLTKTRDIIKGFIRFLISDETSSFLDNRMNKVTFCAIKITGRRSNVNGIGALYPRQMVQNRYVKLEVSMYTIAVTKYSWRKIPKDNIDGSSK